MTAPPPRPASEEPSAGGPRHVLVAGPGRSGTSVVFRTVCEIMAAAGPLEARYEPYLWNITQTENCGDVVSYRFNSDLFSPAGIHTHCTTPLSLREAAAGGTVHADFVSGLFPDSGPRTAAKVIRGLGRLAHYRALRPRLKILIVLRNGFDTVNSAASNFSFFGDEFHPSDRYRFWAEEVLPRGLAPRGFADMSEDELSVLWWRVNLAWAEEALAREDPADCLLVPYEAFRAGRAAWGARIAGFLGLPPIRGETRRMHDRAAGPVTDSVFLKGRALQLAWRHHPAYEALLERFMPAGGDETADGTGSGDSTGQGDRARDPATDIATMRRRIARRFGGLARSGVTTLVPPHVSYVSLRRQIADSRIQVRDLQDETVEQVKAKETAARIRQRARAGRIAAPARTRVPVACIVPAHDAQDTIADTLASLIAQEEVAFSRIVVIDDHSTDRTAEVVRNFGHADRISLIRNDYNIGPAASRHKGIVASGCRFFTQLDADDLAAPDKLALEWEALEEREDRIVYSPHVLQTGIAAEVAAFDTFAGTDDKLWAIACRTTPVPRDMLMSTALYLGSGGYALELWMYEDWLLKLRLCAAGTEWVASPCRAGTLYDRTAPGLSRGSPQVHAQYQLYVLSRMRAEFPDLPRALFVDAVGRCLRRLQRRTVAAETDRIAAALSRDGFDEDLARFWKRAQIGASDHQAQRDLALILGG